MSLDIRLVGQLVRPDRTGLQWEMPHQNCRHCVDCLNQSSFDVTTVDSTAQALHHGLPVLRRYQPIQTAVGHQFDDGEQAVAAAHIEPARSK